RGGLAVEHELLVGSDAAIQQLLAGDLYGERALLGNEELGIVTEDGAWDVAAALVAAQFHAAVLAGAARVVEDDLAVAQVREHVGEVPDEMLDGRGLVLLRRKLALILDQRVAGPLPLAGADAVEEGDARMAKPVQDH